jgi:DNA-binding transcriptional MerR regulator
MSRKKTREWTLKELAAETGVPGRTIRFYISRGLVDPPLRGGRGAAYGKDHKGRLEAMRSLQAQGLTLAEIALVLESGPSGRFIGPTVAARDRRLGAEAEKEDKEMELAAGRMLWFEKDGSLDESQRFLMCPAAEEGRPAAPPLPEPETWRSFAVAPDALVLLRTGTKPWRAKALLAALRRFAAEVSTSNSKPGHGE